MPTSDIIAPFPGAPAASGSTSAPSLEATEADARNPGLGVTYHHMKSLPNING